MTLLRTMALILLAACLLLFVGCNRGITSDVEVTLNEWSVLAAPSEVNAGPVVFAVKNAGKMAHELVIIKTDLAPGALPVKPDGTVDLAAAGTVIDQLRTSQLPPGAQANLDVKLTSGKYVLICNLTGHYALGMHTGLTVR